MKNSIWFYDIREDEQSGNNMWHDHRSLKRNTNNGIKIINGVVLVRLLLVVDLVD